MKSDTTCTASASVRDRVLALASAHAVSMQPTPEDEAGMGITRCSGDDGDMDEVEIALVHLVRGGHLGLSDAQDLLLEHLNECEG